MGDSMDAATLGAALAAVFADSDEAANGQLRDGLASLIQRPAQRKPVAGTEAAGLSSGEAEMLALRQSSDDPQKATALAELLMVRADADTGFEDALKGWWEEAKPLSAGIGNVSSVISGGTFATVLTGQNIHDNTFNFPGLVTPSREMQLPPRIESFVGRDVELEKLVNLLDPARRPRAVRLVGLAGVGKTALATNAAHAAAEKQLFPGGIFFADLQGYDDEPKQPGEMLGRLLRALTGSAQNIPEGTQERLESYRSALARIDAPVLIVLDNASAEAQVQQLLPGGGPHKVLVTSRDILAGLEARQMDIRVLDQETGVALVDRKLRTARPDDDRMASDPDSAAKLAAACDGLPLALWIIAANLEADPVRTAEEVADELADERTRLEALHYVIGGESEISVAAAIGLSYRRLGEEAARLVRLLSAATGPHVTIASAVVLADKPRIQVRRTIGQLLKGHLVEPVENDSQQRLGMHDLVRLYARELAEASPGERHLARTRLLSYYLGSMTYIDAALTRQPPPQAFATSPPAPGHDFTDHHSAIKWAQTEKENLLACTSRLSKDAADGTNDEETAWAMAFAGALAGFLRNEGEWARSIDLQTAAIDTAVRLHAPLAEANFLSERGLLRRLTGHLAPAAADLERAIAIYREIGGEAGQVGEAHALNTYAVVLDQQGKRSEAYQRFNSALDIYRRLNYQLGEANVLQDLGMTGFFAKNYDEAKELLSQALALYSAINQPLGMAHAHSNLASALQSLGLHGEAAEHLEAAQEQYAALDNQLGVVTARIQRAAVLREHHPGEAVGLLEDAIKQSIDIGSPAGHVNALDALAGIRLSDGDRPAAIAMWTRALQITRTQGLRREDVKLTKKLTELDLLRECSEEGLSNGS
jgi:tetratricopeptide (TPR) repeat protein